EDAGMHADIEVDVAEVMDRLAEVHFLQILGPQRDAGDREHRGRTHDLVEVPALHAGSRSLRSHSLPLWFMDTHGSEIRPVPLLFSVRVAASPLASTESTLQLKLRASSLGNVRFLSRFQFRK